MQNLFVKSGRLYLISDRTISGLSHFEIVRNALESGIRIIQLREKNFSKKKIFEEALSLRKLTLKYKSALIINDYVDIALAVNADGIHLGQDDMPIKEARKIAGRHKIIGISTHSVKQALDAQRAGADYIGFGPVFHTDTKDTGKPKGINAVKKIRKQIKIPVVAIGGINLRNAPDVLNTGADAVAVASAIISGDIKANTKKFLSVIDRIKNTYK